jgi:RNA polymerase subunit RPABC4/transcription elongation factor Spt4
MATYKQPCLHCGEFIERDSNLCPKCHSRSPFGYHCPSCFKPIQKGQAVCSGCGRSLYVTCPTCKAQTFAGERCEACGAGLMIHCTNPRCGELQFFENVKCTVCGKKIKRDFGGR